MFDYVIFLCFLLVWNVWRIPGGFLLMFALLFVSWIYVCLLFFLWIVGFLIGWLLDWLRSRGGEAVFFQPEIAFVTLEMICRRRRAVFRKLIVTTRIPALNSESTKSTGN